MRTDDIEGAQPYYKRNSHIHVFKNSHKKELLKSVENSLISDSDEKYQKSGINYLIKNLVKANVTNLPSRRGHITPYENKNNLRVSRANSYERIGTSKSSIRRINKDENSRSMLNNLSSVKNRDVQNLSVKSSLQTQGKYNKKIIFSQPKEKENSEILKEYKNFIRSGSSNFRNMNDSQRYSRRIVNKTTPFGKNNHTKVSRNDRYVNLTQIEKEDIVNKSADIGQRPSKYRDLFNKNLNKTSNEVIHNTSKRSLFKIRQNFKDPNPIPLTKSRRKILEKSSGVYGNFPNLKSLDKSLKLLEDNKNQSIVY